ncbi:CRISPR-associated protein Cas1 [Fibrobacter succinogenes subsp. succinogenes S85]|uniref:CRISPR-associated endonuclease Cas1 n=1 Tax=Fibrobacter succinogenes (strain ATCC 19169 / S85) TaxID=59374 RepID=C9RRG3_FIBSS|nr:CRISPR-associated endonuclease Cas1 [Fibrobacter succinogenes]ACX75149.1 CRISPR-associated protein Cas1 [Fibrobacter succinogenes subsp. succinogenes S85]ADL24821.1 CRISPR-associated protein Cas1 [Fibrobacter succinogenes subsp. succinogenes S85]
MHLYVTEQGTRLGKNGGHLVVQRDGCTIDDILLSEVDSLSLFGAVHPTTDAMLALLDKGADIAFLSSGGRYRGRLVSAVGKNVPLRLCQYDVFRDDDRAFALAKSCVVRKLENGLRVLEAYSKNPHNSFRFENRDEYLRNLNAVRRLQGFDRDELRGFEGNGARIYFENFGRCLACGLDFPGRKYHPSTDPVNALLSFGYTLTARSLESLLESYGMDPMLGYLHEPSYGRNSLAQDMLEEFRHPLVDRLVLFLFNRRVLVADDFEQRNDENSSGQLFLKPEKMRVFLHHYEDFVARPNGIYQGLANLPWRSVMRLRVEAFRRLLLEGVEMADLQWNPEYSESA